MEEDPELWDICAEVTVPVTDPVATLNRLQEAMAEDFPAEVVEAVRLLTHDPDTDYFDYVRSIKGNPVAMKVKLADLAHNTDETRFAGVPVPPERIGCLRDKYTKAKTILLED